MGRQEPAPRRGPRPQRWGIRTLAFLTLALASTLTSNALASSHDAALIVLVFAGQVTGLIGALVCTVRGLRSSGGWLPRG